MAHFIEEFFGKASFDQQYVCRLPPMMKPSENNLKVINDKTNAILKTERSNAY